MEYLDYSLTELPDSVENLFCKPLEKNGTTKPLTDDQTKLLFLLLTLPESETDLMYNKFVSGFPLARILEDRLNVLGHKADKRSIIFISSLCDSPGKIVMYANYLSYIAKKNSIDEITIQEVCEKILPFGGFSEESLNKAWDSQKVRTGGKPGSDNLLDYRSASLSLSK